MYYRINFPDIKIIADDLTFASGYKIYTYKAGTSTALTTYNNKDLAAAHANTNPIILDAFGEATIFVGEATKLILTIPTGDPTSPLREWDYVGEQQSNFVTGLGITATTNNYTVTTTPTVSALSNNFMLIMTPDEDNVTTLTSNVFTGTGVNDCTESGAYLGAAVAVFTVQIDGVATPDTFKWKKDGGAWTTGVAITGAAQTISEGLIVTFAVTTGHTLNDIWAITVQPPARVNLDILGNLMVYKNKGGSVVALDGADMKDGYPAQLILNEALNAWLLINPATPTFSVPTITAVRYRKNLTTTYAMLLADQGYILNCVGTFSVNLLTPPEFSGFFVYIGNFGTGIVTIDAGVGYKIYGYGLQTYTLEYGDVVQLQSNGVDWEVITVSRGVPGGTILPYGGATAPPGYCMCDGAAISRTTYVYLFTIISTAFGVGDGSTTFNLPDLRQRFPLGKAASGTGVTLGGTGGVIDHTHGVTVSGSLTSGTGDMSSTGPGAGFDGSLTANGTSGVNNPPFQAVNFIIKY